MKPRRKYVQHTKYIKYTNLLNGIYCNFICSGPLNLYIFRLPD